MKALASVVLVLVAAGAAAQVPAGGEFVVNTHQPDGQRWPAVAIAPTGGFVVVWTSWHQDGSATGVFGQQYTRDGLPRGAEFQVNTFTSGYQNWYGNNSVATFARGGFVVTWASQYQDGDGWGVFGQRYGADGARLGGEFQVNTFTTGSQGGNQSFYTEVVVGSSPSGRFVVVWTGDQDGAATEIYAQRYDGGGSRVGGEFRVNTVTAGYQGSPAVSMSSSGAFVVTWSTPDGSGSGVAARRYDAAGAAVGGEFLVNSYTTGNQGFDTWMPSPVALAEDGTFVAAWESVGQDGSGRGIVGRRFDGANSPLTAEFLVNTYTTGTQAFPALARDESGNFVVAWQSADGDTFGIFGQRFLADGTRRGAEFLVNNDTAGFQNSPSVAVDAAGNFAAAWDGLDASTGGVRARRFGAIFPDVVRVDGTGNGILEPGETVDVRPAWRNLSGAAQALTSALGSPAGPPGGLPTILDGAGDYGTVPDGNAGFCIDCFTVSVPAPSARPAVHWDASVVETLAPDEEGQSKAWRLHVGLSFDDVPDSNPFYRYVETLLHNGVTGGCGAGTYCPTASTTREQMAVFVLVAKEGAGYLPAACGASPMFADVPATSPFCRWVEELARRGVVAGCGGGNYCPAGVVTREQMPVFALRTLDPSLAPPACAAPNLFADVPDTSPFCRWIEELVRRSVVTGCGGGNYCPSLAVSREQMGVFIGATFGLPLYGF